MKQKNILRTLLLTAAAAFSLAVFARADVPLDHPPLATTPVGQGLLGQNYANLTYSYIDLDNSSVNADRFSFGFNQPLNAGLDAVFTYDWTQDGLFAGFRPSTQSVTAALRAFSNVYLWGKPYVDAGIGYAWQHNTPTGSHNSFLWEVSGGVELQVAPAVTVTPYLQYTDTPSLAAGGTLTLGVKANYWVDSQWAVTVGLARDDSHNTLFTVGTNFRF